jgi:hypothetical protein
MAHQRRYTTPAANPPPNLFSCRYCLDDDHLENLISPCICQGSVKYIHNRCLLRWYALNPTTGLQCSICKTECAHRVDQPIESPFSTEFTKRAGLEHPFIIIFLYHWIYAFFCLCAFQMETFGEMRNYYGIFQSFFTGMYLGLFSVSVWRVKQKRMYLQKWFFTSRGLLPLFHLYCIWLIPRYTWIGGVTGNLCCFHYFYAHSHILEDLNGRATFCFITRRPARLPLSSSESS